MSTTLHNADRECARNILAEFVHTQPPADFMEDHVTNHISAHRVAYTQLTKIEQVGEAIMRWLCITTACAVLVMVAAAWAVTYVELR